MSSHQHQDEAIIIFQLAPTATTATAAGWFGNREKTRMPKSYYWVVHLARGSTPSYLVIRPLPDIGPGIQNSSNSIRIDLQIFTSLSKALQGFQEGLLKTPLFSLRLHVMLT